MRDEGGTPVWRVEGFQPVHIGLDPHSGAQLLLYAGSWPDGVFLGKNKKLGECGKRKKTKPLPKKEGNFIFFLFKVDGSEENTADIFVSFILFFFIF